MTATRPPVVSDDDLTTARQPMNQRASPSPGPSAIGGDRAGCVRHAASSLSDFRESYRFTNWREATPLRRTCQGFAERCVS